MKKITRRTFARRAGSGIAAASAALAMPAIGRAQASARVVVIGGGPGGATAARYIARDSEGAIEVTLVEPQRQYTTCFYSNLYLGGLRDLASITHGYDKLAGEGVRVVNDTATAIDPTGRTATLAGGDQLSWDRLVVAPGIDIRYDSIERYDEAAAEVMPHAWKAGAQTQILREQLEDMEDGGVFVLAAPPDPYRCPPGPYERVCMVAHYLKANKPRSKIIVLDAKDKFSKQALFTDAWNRYYEGMVDWVPAEFGGVVTRVDAATRTVVTDTETIEAAVANIVPAQTAGRIAHDAGLVDDSGWCPVVPETFESRLQPGIHVIGDASIATAMPKSAFSANSQAKVVAMTVRHALTDSRLFPPRLRNTCWSWLSSEDAVKIGANYEPGETDLAAVDSFISQVGETVELRAQTADEADGWYAGITADVFG